MHFILCAQIRKSNRASGTHHSQVGPVGLGGSDAAVLHDPLVRPPLLASITAVVAEAPGAVHQHLLGQNLQGTRLEDESDKVTARQPPPLRQFTR